VGDTVGVPGSDLERLRQQVEALFVSGVLQPNEAVAKMLGVSGRTLRRLGDEGKIGYFNLGLSPRGHRKYTLEDVTTYLRGEHSGFNHSREWSKASRIRTKGKELEYSDKERRIIEAINAHRRIRGVHAYIYFLQSDDAVKIGTSTNITMRLGVLRCATPYGAQLIGAMPGGRALEADLHERFSSYRLCGEWFSLVPPLTNFIETNTMEGWYDD
jgi:hypothetical protein